jgi:hypothetical protein
VSAEHADRLARLHEEGLVLLQPLERFDDRVESIPNCARRGRSRRRRPGSADPRRPSSSRLFISIRTAASVGPGSRLDLTPAARSDVAAVVASIGQLSAPLKIRRSGPGSPTQ